MTGRTQKVWRIAAAVCAVALAVGIYFLLGVPKTGVTPYAEPNKEIVQQGEELRSEPVPEDPEQQAVYFSQLAYNYEQLRNFSAARDYYLQAQAAVDANGLHSQVVYYEDIARSYKQEGDVAKAREYFEKQKVHLQAFLNDHPDDEPTKQAIKTIEAKLREIN
jgi:tetratricopeptide (TPR) repeat protein